jgi:hypothetical protein
LQLCRQNQYHIICGANQKLQASERKTLLNNFC